MKNYRTTIAGICAAIAGALGTGAIRGVPPSAQPYLMLAAMVLMGLAHYLAPDAATTPVLPDAAPKDGAK